jgi:hypothetical protein
MLRVAASVDQDLGETTRIDSLVDQSIYFAALQPV